MITVAIDIGGTFTDLVGVDDKGRRFAPTKTKKMQMELKGAKTGLIVPRGTRDVYIIGRGNRPEAYNLFFHRHRPLVPRHLTREIDERVMGSGDVHHPLNKASVTEACRALAAEGVEAVAVCLLHAYANPDHERIAGAMVREA